MPLNHVGSQILTTPRLVLRPFALDDAQAMFDNWASDPMVTQFMMWPTHQTLETTCSILTEWVEQYQKADYYHWCITLNKEPVGAVCLIIHNSRAMVGEVGYNIGRRWWGQGITSEAAQAVIDFGFEIIGFNRIEAIHSIANPGSGAVMKHCGMSYEGHQRQKYLSSRGTLEDCDLYGILKEDWEKQKNQQHCQ